jgi:hypothetical protein
MHILHKISGYSLMGGDTKLTIFITRWLAGTFCAYAQAAEAVVHHGDARLKIYPVQFRLRVAPRQLTIGFGI